MGPRRSVLLLSALLCALALCCAAPALALEPAGDGWYWASPQPQGNVLSAVAFGDALNAWSVGDGGTILHSSDAGVTWHLQASPATVPLGSVQFVGAAQGWAAGGDGWYSTIPSESANGVILHTSDGGATWAAQKTVPGSAISDLAFAGDRQGWAVGGRGLILHTADGGQAWTGQESGVTRNILSVAFADAQHGYAGCADGLILTTSDGGGTWARRAGRSLEIADVISLAIGAEGKVWAAVGGRDWSGRFPRIYSSANGGRTWRYARVDFTYAVWDVVASDDDVYAVGPVDDPAGRMDVSRVLVSHDDGATWASRVTGAAQLAGIAATSAGGLCAVGDTTVTSVDDGITWSPRSTRGELVGSIDMVGPTEAWGVGGWATGVLEGLFAGTEGASETPLLHTSDGARWPTAFTAAGEHFNAVDFADPGHGWAVGTGGLIRHTADAGATWHVQESGGRTALSLVAAPTSDAAWVFGYGFAKRGLKADLLRTADAGATWTGLAIPDSVYPFAMTAASADEAWLAGIRSPGTPAKRSAPVVVHTTDGGATWSRATLPLPSTTVTIPLSVDFVDSRHGWVTALGIMDGSSTILATSDGGATWAVVATPDEFGSDVIVSLSFADTGEGWASGTSIYHTTDGGQTWVRQVAGSLETGSFVNAWDATHALAAGLGVLSTGDVPGDTAAPATLRDAAGGWTRTDVAVTLSAADIGASGLASTEYSVDGGAWTAGVTPPPFLAPADHSGDGTHLLQYRSTDAAGNTEPTQALRVRVDTVKPVTRLGRAVLGRDGVLRMRLRVSDSSCASVTDFGFGVRTLRGRPVGGVFYEGLRLRTNKAVTLRDEMLGEYLDAGTYRVVFRAVDRAGNEQARPARGLLVVKPHKHRAWPGRPPMSLTGAGAWGTYTFDGARAAEGAGAAAEAAAHRSARSQPAATRLTAELRRLYARITAAAR